MNQILEWLSGGDLRSDGMAPEVAELVLKDPSLLADLMAGLSSSNDVVRGRTADAVEKVSRSRPDLILGYFNHLAELAGSDRVPMVKMHLAMIFGNLAIYEDRVEEIYDLLLRLLKDRSVFVRSWAISSLAIVGRKYPDRTAQILEQIGMQQKDRSIAIRTRASKAVRLLINDSESFPEGWIKSVELLRDLD